MKNMEYSMKELEYSLFEIIRDPGLWVYEASEMSDDSHYYLYRYDAEEGVFTRATVPAGATAPHFNSLRPTAKVPIGGWRKLERRELPPLRLRLVGARRTASRRDKASQAVQ